MKDDSDGNNNGNGDPPPYQRRQKPPPDFATSRYIGGPKKPRPAAHLAPVSDVLTNLLQNSKSQLADGFQRYRLERDWNSVVGQTIAEQTLPAAFEKGTLFIWVRHSAWMQQLWYFQDAIKEKVNTYLGRPWVTQVKFTLSRRAATRPIGSDAADR